MNLLRELMSGQTVLLRSAKTLSRDLRMVRFWYLGGSKRVIEILLLYIRPDKSSCLWSESCKGERRT